MASFFNRTVQTPIGEGVAQSSLIHDKSGNKYVVRLPINEQTKPHLKDANCITQRADRTGLWFFLEKELSLPGSNVEVKQ